MVTRTLIVDNGAYSVKFGYADEIEPKIVKNAVARGHVDKRTFVADEIDFCDNTTRLYMKSPFDKGYLCSWDIQKEVWDRIFSSNGYDLPSTDLIMTEPYFNLPNIQNAYDEMIFEEYCFKSFYRSYPATLAQYSYLNIIQQSVDPSLQHLPDCILVVDSGYSFTHIVPHFRGVPINEGIRRINVGGKLLTNHLKELVSFRYFNMMEETFILNDLKEATTFVSKSFEVDLKKSRKSNEYVLDYILPNFTTRTRGVVKTEPTGPDNQIIQMNNERFSVPEVLFTPANLGIRSGGICDAIEESVFAVDDEMRPLMTANIFVMGGNAKMAGFSERIKEDAKQFCPSWYNMNVTQSQNPQTAAWYGGKYLAGQYTEPLGSRVTRSEYHEYGHSIWKRKHL